MAYLWIYSIKRIRFYLFLLTPKHDHEKRFEVYATRISKEVTAIHRVREYISTHWRGWGTPKSHKPVNTPGLNSASPDKKGPLTSAVR